MSVSVRTVRGWDVVRLESETVAVDVLPGKGGDVLAATWLPLGVNVLWTTPWGLREKGAVSTSPDSQGAFLERYPGGWQTIFPSGGGANRVNDVELGFHGEAALVPWDWEQGAGDVIVLSTTLMRSPFVLRRELRLDGSVLTVTESARNTSRVDQPTMWSHHPAFGAPFLDGSCVIEVGARTFLSDPDYATPNGDLQPGSTSTWPMARGRDGGEVDLSHAPGVEDAVDRFGYLTDFAEPWYRITNPVLGLAATMRWDGEAFPHAWWWCEAAGTVGYPWHQRAYVLAVEPATSYPGSGLARVLEDGSTALWFAPGQEREVTLTLELGTA